MQITLSKCSDDPTVVNKTLAGAVSFNDCTATEAVNVDSPVILLNTTVDISDYNYCYIPEFGRYYFVNSRSYIRNGLVSIGLESDVLMSFKDELLQISGTIARNENIKNAYIADGRYIGKIYKNIVTIQYPNEFNATSHILITA